MSDAADEALTMPPVAQVRVASIRARGFRCIENLGLTLEPATTYLVGENNTGKTSLLLALSAALGRYRATIDDLHRDAAGVSADHAEVDLIIVPSDAVAFGDHERGALGGNVHQLPGGAGEFAGVRTVLTPSREGGQLLTQRSFLQPGRRGLVVSPSEFLGSSLGLFECELLDASRDLVADLGSKSSRWGRVLFDLQIPELPELDGAPNPLSRSTLEAAMKALAADMRSASPVLGQLETDLGRLSQVQRSVGQVSLLPFPPQIEEVMRSVEILLSHEGSPSLPLRFHGMGSRSLAALFVFSTLCALRGGADLGLRPHFLTLVEEPESHLHPHAITALRAELELLPGQRIVSTHSTQLVTEAPPKSLRVLRRGTGSFRVFQLSADTIADTAKFRRFVERPFGEFFFSRLVVFGDGAAERDALPVLLAAALGVSPSALGVTIVDCESMNHPQIPKLVAAANELGLPWLVFADNDDKGIEAVGKLEDPDTGSALEMASPRVVIAGARAIEQLLLDAGFGQEVTDIASDHGDSVTTDGERLKFLKKHKGWAGEAVSLLALQRNKDVPAPVVELSLRIQTTLGLKLEAGTVEGP